MNANRLFDNIYDGRIAPLERSGALSHFAYVVLMRVQNRCGPITVSGDQMIFCNLSMQAKVYDHSGQTVVDTSARATGLGFSEEEALDVAVKRLVAEAKTSILAALQK